ncbi:DUF1223 domain-containing protein [Paracoccus aerodenitrificans]|uniref:DUF1223 domain-containing protein n=1 Tax=Paracoccus aerodenitrificans TaxID=3017781 RepID=UPI0022F0F662|nr:DUF1223 domain-containing protein [Paracoccus aerodenitrificans]WBU63153.1 DUF1223 domain-containing protein [Paracoccus aerodenitrificans]
MKSSGVISAAILVFTLCAGSVPAVAQSGQDDPGRDRQAQADRGYADIMDDVNAVFDALNGDDAGNAEAPARSTDTNAEAAFSAPENTTRRAVPEAATPSPRRGQAVQMAAPEGPRTPSPVVVELFTAQGCAACPPATDMLADLTGRNDVLLLSWHVDYWDYLGWRDDFARPQFSLRQKAYNLARGSRLLFTPQIIVGGESGINDMRPAHLMTAIKRELAEGGRIDILRRESGPSVEIELTPRMQLPPDLVVELVRYLPDRTVTIGAGENAGQTLRMYNIVVASDILAEWDGSVPLRLTVTLRAGNAQDLPEDTRHALIVQEMQGPYPGEIFAAVRLD